MSRLDRDKVAADLPPQLVRGHPGGRKSAGAAAMSRTSQKRTPPRAASASCSVVPNRGAAPRARWIGPRLPQSGSPPHRAGRRCGKGEAHAPAGAIADETNGIDRLAGATGGDQDPQTAPGAARVLQGALNPRRGGAGSGNPVAKLPARGQWSPLGVDTVTPRAARVARLAWVAPSANIWSFIAGARAVARRRQERRW